MLFHAYVMMIIIIIIIPILYSVLPSMKVTRLTIAVYIGRKKMLSTKSKTEENFALSNMLSVFAKRVWAPETCVSCLRQESKPTWECNDANRLEMQ